MWLLWQWVPLIYWKEWCHVLSELEENINVLDAWFMWKCHSLECNVHANPAATLLCTLRKSWLPRITQCGLMKLVSGLDTSGGMRLQMEFRYIHWMLCKSIWLSCLHWCSGRYPFVWCFIIICWCSVGHVLWVCESVSLWVCESVSLWVWVCESVSLWVWLLQI